MTARRSNTHNVAREPSERFLKSSPHLARALKESLGNDAGTELVSAVDQAFDDLSALRGDIAELRHETERRFARVDAQFSDVRTSIERQTNKLILWSFAFWATVMLSIVGLRR